MDALSTILLAGAKTIDPYIKAYNGYSSAMNIVKGAFTSLKHTFTVKNYDVNQVFQNIKDEQINVGTIIEVNGYLINYGQIFKPYTHIDGMFGKCKKVGEKQNYKNGKITVQATMNMQYNLFQPPVQKLPNYKGIGCAFLYDTRFKGFMHMQNPVAEERNKKPIIIDEYSKPIMLLYDANKQSSFINKEVNVKARVMKLPIELAKQINGVFDDGIREICSNFIDLYAESVNFICLVALDNETSVHNYGNIDGLLELTVPLYVEMELEKLGDYCDKQVAQKLIESILPNLPQKLDPQFPLTVANTTSDIGIPFISTNDFQIVFREPNVIGFYTDALIFDSEEYPKKLREYATVVNNFAIDYKNTFKKNYGIKDSLKLNFLFDYEKQLLFDSRGVLYSNAANLISESDEKEKYVQEWLRESAVRL